MQARRTNQTSPSPARSPFAQSQQRARCATIAKQAKWQNAGAVASRAHAGHRMRSCCCNEWQNKYRSYETAATLYRAAHNGTATAFAARAAQKCTAATIDEKCCASIMRLTRRKGSIVNN